MFSRFCYLVKEKVLPPIEKSLVREYLACLSLRVGGRDTPFHRLAAVAAAAAVALVCAPVRGSYLPPLPPFRRRCSSVASSAARALAML